MPHDQVRIAEVNAWFKKAAGDLSACSRLLEGDNPLCDAAVFHAQQAVEKTIKGFLTWHDRSFGKTHNVVEIGKKAVDIDPELEKLLRRASHLTQYAWRFRYPGEPEEPTADEALEALNLAKEVLEELSDRLPHGFPLLPVGP